MFTIIAAAESVWKLPTNRFNGCISKQSNKIASLKEGVKILVVDEKNFLSKCHAFDNFRFRWLSISKFQKTGKCHMLNKKARRRATTSLNLCWRCLLKGRKLLFFKILSFSSIHKIEKFSKFCKKPQNYSATDTFEKYNQLIRIQPQNCHFWPFWINSSLFEKKHLFFQKRNILNLTNSVAFCRKFATMKKIHCQKVSD